MRLINADKFKQEIAAAAVRDNLVTSKCNAMCRLIDGQPTVFELKEVMQQLEEKTELAYSRYMDCPLCSPCSERYRTQYEERKMFLDIVKAGIKG